MTGCKTDEAREFYLRLCIANRYTKRELDRQIGSMLYERTMISHEKIRTCLLGTVDLRLCAIPMCLNFSTLKNRTRKRICGIRLSRI